MRLSQTEGWGSRPSDPGLYPPGLDSAAPGWPPDIESASVILTTHADAMQYVGGGTEAGDGSRLVLVIRLVGDFSWITTGPPGHGPVTGNVATIVVDATTGQGTDTGLETVSSPAGLPGATLLYKNPAVRASAATPPSVFLSSPAGQASASQLPTCGPAPVSDGPLARKVVATIEGSSSAVTGTMLHVHVAVRPTVSGSVFVSTGSPAIVFILRGTTVVGQTLGPMAGVGLEGDVTATSPMLVDAFITLSGCGRVTSTDSAVSPSYGAPLTPGAYSLIAVMEDATDGEGSGKVFVSEPFPLTVTPADTAVTSAAPGSSKPS